MIYYVLRCAVCWIMNVFMLLCYYVEYRCYWCAYFLHRWEPHASDSKRKREGGGREAYISLFYICLCITVLWHVPYHLHIVELKILWGLILWCWIRKLGEKGWKGRREERDEEVMVHTSRYHVHQLMRSLRVHCVFVACSLRTHASAACTSLV